MINKSFPANNKLDIKTFLNDSKIDGELYGLLLALSKGDKGQTVIEKGAIPTFTELGRSFGYTRQTAASHFKYLLTKGYLEETNNGKSYYILNPEKYYFNIPLDTLQYLLDNCNAFVIKVYIYLGTCWNTKPGEYEFTIKEICEHLGINYHNFLSRIRNILDLLIKLKLIGVETVYRKQLPYMRLVKFSTKVQKEKEVC